MRTEMTQSFVQDIPQKAAPLSPNMEERADQDQAFEEIDWKKLISSLEDIIFKSLADAANSPPTTPPTTPTPLAGSEPQVSQSAESQDEKSKEFKVIKLFDPLSHRSSSCKGYQRMYYEEIMSSPTSTSPLLASSSSAGPERGASPQPAESQDDKFKDYTEFETLQLFDPVSQGSSSSCKGYQRMYYEKIMSPPTSTSPLLESSSAGPERGASPQPAESQDDKFEDFTEFQTIQLFGLQGPVISLSSVLESFFKEDITVSPPTSPLLASSTPGPECSSSPQPAESQDDKFEDHMEFESIQLDHSSPLISPSSVFESSYKKDFMTSPPTSTSPLPASSSAGPECSSSPQPAESQDDKFEDYTDFDTLQLFDFLKPANSPSPALESFFKEDNNVLDSMDDGTIEFDQQQHKEEPISLPAGSNQSSNSRKRKSEGMQQDYEPDMKRPRDAFTIHMSMQRKSVPPEIEQNGSADVARYFDEKWSSMTESEKAVYRELSQTETEHHQRLNPDLTTTDKQGKMRMGERVREAPAMPSLQAMPTAVTEPLIQPRVFMRQSRPQTGWMVPCHPQPGPQLPHHPQIVVPAQPSVQQQILSDSRIVTNPFFGQMGTMPPPNVTWMGQANTRTYVMEPHRPHIVQVQPPARQMGFPVPYYHPGFPPQVFGPYGPWH